MGSILQYGLNLPFTRDNIGADRLPSSLPLFYMWPKLKFKNEFQKDLYSLNAFINDAKFDNGRSLKWAVLKHYPELKNYIDSKSFKVTDKKSVKKFIKQEHHKNHSSIENNLKVYNENWIAKEKDFFRLVKILFGGHKWPKGKYIAYPTIWGMFPRYLEDKTFQVPYKWKKSHISM